MVQHISPIHSRARRAPRLGRAAATVLGAVATVSIALGGLGLAATPAVATPTGDATGGTSLTNLAPTEVGTSLTLSVIVQPTEYGDFLVASSSLTLDGPANLNGHQIRLLDGATEVGIGTLLYTGSGKFSSIAVVMTPLSAGTHTLRAVYAGAPGGGTDGRDVAPAESAAVIVVVNPRTTTTTITAAPASATVGVPIAVTGKVSTANSMPVSGNVSLLAGADPIASAPVDAGGNFTFGNVSVPFGSGALTAQYLGSADGNFAPSQAISPVSVIAAMTDTEVTRATPVLRADGLLSVDVDVTNLASGAAGAPTGSVALYIDDVLTATVPGPSATSGAVSTFSASFPFDVEEFGLGSHAVTAEFIADPGFGSSEDLWGSIITVRGIETILVPGAERVFGTPNAPATVSITTTVAHPDPDEFGPVLTRQLLTPAPTVTDGYVQAFANGTPVGDPVTLQGGAGTYSFDGLAVGEHTIDLRFVPSTPGHLASTTSVLVTVTADATPPVVQPETTPAKPATSDTLAHTGAATTAVAGAGGALALLIGAALLAFSRRRARA